MFTLKIDQMRNSAFVDGEDPGAELARLLRVLADKIELGAAGPGSDGVLLDWNGNTVGRWGWSK